MNHFLVGTADKTDRLLDITTPGFLLIDDGPIADAFLDYFPRARLFDPAQHSFNPLRGIDVPKARAFAQAVWPDKDLMTYDKGKRAFVQMLLKGSRLDRLPAVTHKGYEEARETIDDLLLSPVLRQVFCQPTNFSFKGSVVAKIDRCELGDFDAFVLATFLIGQAKGQIILPDFGFYGRDFYMSLVRQDRLTAGVQFLSELSLKLHQTMLLVKDKTIYRTSQKDADELIVFTRHIETRNLIGLRGNAYELSII